LLELLNLGGTQTNIYLEALQSLAVDTGILPHPILPKRLLPKRTKIPKRAITLEEHRRLHSSLRSCRWRAFLQILWETGAAEADAASLKIESCKNNTINYYRCKTGQRAAQHILDELSKTPSSLTAGRRRGYFLPTIQQMGSKDRAAIFRRLCIRTRTEGVTLHSYCYAWAERALSLGMPERLAMVTLGHKSIAIHRVYAKGATIVASSLSGFQASSPNPAEASYERAESAY
jgi:integrase